MKSVSKLLVVGLVSLGVSVAWATPSTQIWIPSTDVQAFGVPHLGLDSYLRDKGSQESDMFDGGLTIGVLPFDSIQMEVGADYVSTFSGSKSDDHPVYFNAKLGVPEGVICTNAPAIAFGGYNFGTKTHDANRTDQNIIYGLAAKTLPSICDLPSFGRVSAGYYVGNDEVLLDAAGNASNKGILLSWDRTMSEIDDRLWFAVDYQGGDNVNGALSFGISWAFTPNTSVILGYDVWNKKSVAGENTYTIQWDFNF